jgi:hypothetical protein
MSLEAVYARISALQTAFTPPAPAPPAPQAAPAPSSNPSFAGALQGANAAALLSPVAPPVQTAGGTGAGQAVLNAVRGEVGQAEQPPGSNDSPRIAQYRQATAGSGVGPWCAYFVSWAARQAGTPLGEAGQGFGRVDDVWAWAERSGKAMPAATAQPQPGDLIVWDEHIGVVESVDPDGSVHTIEGNSSDSVARRTYGRDGGGAVGYVRLG